MIFAQEQAAKEPVFRLARWSDLGLRSILGCSGNSRDEWM